MLVKCCNSQPSLIENPLRIQPCRDVFKLCHINILQGWLIPFWIKDEMRTIIVVSLTPFSDIDFCIYLRNLTLNFGHLLVLAQY